MDDEDQSWVDDVRRSYQNPLQQQNSASKVPPGMFKKYYADNQLSKVDFVEEI